MKKINRIIAAAMAVTMCFSASASVAAYGWQGSAGTGKYIQENGEAAKGVMNIDGVVYRFSSDGTCLGRYTGIGRKNGVIRYYNDGIMFTGGWLRLPGGTYYFDESGKGAVGIVTIDGKQYNFGSDGCLKDISHSISITADKEYIVLGNREKIKFTFTADNIGGTASFGEISELQRYSDGKWYKVKPSGEYAVDDIAYMLGMVDGPYNYIGSQELYFTPEAYSDKLTTGRYRIASTISTEEGRKRCFCEFTVLDQAAVRASRESYDIQSTERIDMSGYAVKAGYYYGEAEELYILNTETDQWDKIKPAYTDYSKGDVLICAESGDKISCFLDLTRYSRTKLRSGTYRALIGDNITCEFKLTNPFDVSAEQTETESRRKKQIMISFVNETEKDITVKGYGELLRWEKGKWKKVSLKRGASLDTQITIPAMHKWEKSMLLNNYYSIDSLKKGSYCMKFPVSGGGYMYAYFDLK